MSLAGFTQRDIAEMVEAAGLLSPVGYLGHISSELILDMVNLHLDQACLFLVLLIHIKKFFCAKMTTYVHLQQLVLAMGFHQLNLRRFIRVNPFPPIFIYYGFILYIIVAYHVLLIFSDWFINLLDSICYSRIDCNDLLSSITG